jgi:hypothetical protein
VTAPSRGPYSERFESFLGRFDVLAGEVAQTLSLRRVVNLTRAIAQALTLTIAVAASIVSGL